MTRAQMLFHLCADRGIDPAGTKGASIHLRSLSTSMSASRHVVMLASRRSTDSIGETTGRRVDIESLDGVSSILAAAERHGAPDVVYERYSLGSTAGLDAARILDRPFVLEVNAPLVLEARRHRPGTVDASADECEQRLLAEADLVITVSHPLREYAGRWRGDRPTVVVPNGCSPDAFTVSGGPADTPLLAFLGHPKPWHGADRLVPVLTGVRSHGFDARLRIIGGGDGADAVVAAAVDAGVGHLIDVTGPVDHVTAARSTAEAWVGLAPYHHDDFFYFCPLKVIEYMAAGVPVVASRLGDIPALVDDAGLLVDADDTPGLVDAVCTVLADAELRVALGRRGAARTLDSFTWDAAAGATLAAIDTLLGSPKGSR